MHKVHSCGMARPNRAHHTQSCVTAFSPSSLFSHDGHFPHLFTELIPARANFSSSRMPYAPTFPHHRVFRARDPLHSTKNHRPHLCADELEPITRHFPPRVATYKLITTSHLCDHLVILLCSSQDDRYGQPKRYHPCNDIT